MSYLYRPSALILQGKPMWEKVSGDYGITLASPSGTTIADIASFYEKEALKT